ncbi:MAG: PAS domain S-box protein [Desulfobacterales bacterium]|jgi:PAS domain S-box-containing protein
MRKESRQPGYEDFRSLSFDVTTIKALMASTNRYKTLFESAGDAIFLLDLNGQILDANRIACEQLNYSRNELKDATTMDIISPEYAPAWPQKMEDLQVLNHIIFETALMRKNGSVIPVETSCRAIEYDNDPAVLVIARDITERIQSENEKAKLRAQLRQAQKMEAIGTLAGGIAHDFNNILQAIIGYTEITMLQMAKGRDPKASLENILTASQRAKELINQILSFSRQSEQERKPIQINIIVKEVLKLIRASLPATIEIQGKNLNTQTVVEADPIQIHQVMMNLCSNAHHAMRQKGGVLEIVMASVHIDEESAGKFTELSRGDYLKLTIRDTGMGIPPDHMERIFDPYFTSKEKGEGTGLGLAVVHGIVKSHQGAIQVESKVGEGTSFHLYFPARDAPAIETQFEEDHHPHKGNERILFVDDEPTLAAIGQEMLETLGYKVETKTSSESALSLFRKSPDQFDLIITDLTMPSMPGDVMVQEMLKVRKNIPIILFTGYSDLLSQERFDELGIRDCLLKPLTRWDLATAVRKVLDTTADALKPEIEEPPSTASQEGPESTANTADD